MTGALEIVDERAPAKSGPGVVFRATRRKGSRPLFASSSHAYASLSATPNGGRTSTTHSAADRRADTPLRRGRAPSAVPPTRKNGTSEPSSRGHRVQLLVGHAQLPHPPQARQRGGGVAAATAQARLHRDVLFERDDARRAARPLAPRPATAAAPLSRRGSCDRSARPACRSGSRTARAAPRTSTRSKRSIACRIV